MVTTERPMHALDFRSVPSSDALDALTYPVLALVTRWGSVDATSPVIGAPATIAVHGDRDTRHFHVEVRADAVRVRTPDDPAQIVTLRHGEGIAVTGGTDLVFLAHPDPECATVPRASLGRMIVGELGPGPSPVCAVADALRCPGHRLAATRTPGIRARACHVCATLVHDVATAEELVHHLQAGHCVAVAPVLAAMVQVVRRGAGDGRDGGIGQPDVAFLVERLEAGVDGA